MSVFKGVDPHKASNTAGAIGGDEREVAKVTIRTTCQQIAKLVAWAEPFAERTWDIESADGLGYLLAPQLVDAGEVVLDVPPALASRVRVLSTGRSEKNDPNDNELSWIHGPLIYMTERGYPAPSSTTSRSSTTANGPKPGSVISAR
jgi:Transposase